MKQISGVVSVLSAGAIVLAGCSSNTPASNQAENSSTTSTTTLEQLPTDTTSAQPTQPETEPPQDSNGHNDTPPPSTVNPPVTNTSNPPQTSNQRCKGDMLSLSLGRADGALGSVYIPINFTNVSDETCTLYGYPGVSAVANDIQLGAPADRDYSVDPSLVTLTPGGTVSASLRIGNAHNYSPESRCQLTEATDIRVYPPNSYSSVLLPHEFVACTTDLVFMTVRPVVS